MSTLQSVIEPAWECRAELEPDARRAELRERRRGMPRGADAGTLRVAEPRDGGWVVNQWLKQAVLLSFRINDDQVVDAGYTASSTRCCEVRAHDARAFKQRRRARRSGAVVRRGAYIARDVVLMPSFVNIGHLDQGTMIDTWATSAAARRWQARAPFGRRDRRRARAVGSRPTIIEDHCFIGARSRSLKASSSSAQRARHGRQHRAEHEIHDPETGEIHYGRVPALRRRRGNLPSKDSSTRCTRCHRQKCRREDALQDLAERPSPHNRLRAKTGGGRGGEGGRGRGGGREGGSGGPL